MFKILAIKLQLETKWITPPYPSVLISLKVGTIFFLYFNYPVLSDINLKVTLIEFKLQETLNIFLKSFIKNYAFHFFFFFDLTIHHFDFNPHYNFSHMSTLAQ